MKRTIQFSIFPLLLVVSLFVPKTWAETATVDPAATDILMRMTDYLGSVKQFTVQTQNTLEDLLISGHRIDLDVSADVIVSRPNKLRAERRGDAVDQVFYYDGKSLTLYNPSDKVYATVPVADTFEGLFKYMAESLGFVVPVSDLIYQNAFPLLMQDVNMAVLIAKTVIDGVKCDHLFFSSPGVDFQVWVAEGARPLPYKFVVTDTSTPLRLSISTLMSKWNVEPAVKDTDFTFVPPKETQAIDFMPL